MATIIELGKQDVDTKGFLFVANALSPSKGDKRPHTNHIYIDDGRAVATTGYKLNIYELQRKYRRGAYRVIKKQKGKNGHIVLIREPNLRIKDFPNYKPIFSDKRSPTTEKLVKHGSNGAAMAGFYASFYGTVEAMGRTVNPDLFSDLPDGDWDVSFTVNDEDILKAVIFARDNMISVVMAMLF